MPSIPLMRYECLYFPCPAHPFCIFPSFKSNGPKLLYTTNRCVKICSCVLTLESLRLYNFEIKPYFYVKLNKLFFIFRPSLHTDVSLRMGQEEPFRPNEFFWTFDFQRTLPTLCPPRIFSITWKRSFS